MEKQNTIYKFKELYRGENFPFGIALFNDQNNIIGFCVLKIINLEKHKEFLTWISNLIILKEYRGKGYGKLLIKEANKILKELGYKKVYLWTDQTPGFYKKIGFKYLQKVEKNEGGYGVLFYIDI